VFVLLFPEVVIGLIILLGGASVGGALRVFGFVILVALLEFVSAGDQLSVKSASLLHVLLIG
jgi:hypothetical protein